MNNPHESGDGLNPSHYLAAALYTAARQMIPHLIELPPKVGIEKWENVPLVYREPFIQFARWVLKYTDNYKVEYANAIAKESEKRE